MTPEDLYDNLPADPERAFLALEKVFRDECESRVKLAHEEENVSVIYVNYIAQVLAAIAELGLATEFKSEVPTIEDVGYNTYINFSKDVKNYCTRLEIRYARRVQGHSVCFDATAKSKIRHFTSQIKDVIDRLEVESDKRDALHGKLLAFEKEVGRDRTRLEAYGELVIATAGILGDTAEKLKPVQDLLEAIGRLIWRTKQDKETLSLPENGDQKRIEPPEPQLDRRSPRDLEDEVPF